MFGRIDDRLGKIEASCEHHQTYIDSHEAQIQAWWYNQRIWNDKKDDAMTELEKAQGRILVRMAESKVKLGLIFAVVVVVATAVGTVVAKRLLGS